jgi:hypothetical protein
MFISAEKGSVGRDITIVRSIKHSSALSLLYVKLITLAMIPQSGALPH